MTAWCATHEPPRLSEAVIAAMDHEALVEAAAILEFGEANCDWQP